MSKPLITAKPDDSLADVVKLMGQKDVRRIPIVKDGILYGVFTTKDLAAHFNEYEDLIVRDLVKNLYCPF
jgi:CBS domain-containing protein